MAAPDAEIRLDQEVQQLLDRIVKQEGYTTPNFTITMATKPGDNYNGVVYRVQVDDVEKPKPLSLIVKCQPSSEGRVLNFDTALYFRKEAEFYNLVLPAFWNLQREHGIPDEEFSPHVPTCHHASHVLVLEDMSPRGYIMLDKKITLDYSHCVLVLVELARLHALSLALKDQRPEIYEKITKYMVEGFLSPDIDPRLRGQFDAAVSRAIDKFKERHVTMKDYRRYVDLLETFFDGYYDKLLRIVSKEAAAPYQVINHGDCWTNNLLFKYAPNADAPERLCLLDFQVDRQCSPATDVSYFIHHCTDKSLRDKHYDDFIDVYYENLAGFMERLGSRAEVVFPRSALDDQLMKFSKFALAMSTFELPEFTSDAIDVGNTAINEEACWQRIGDVFIDMVERGYAD